MKRNHEGREDFQLGDVQYQEEAKRDRPGQDNGVSREGETAKRADTLIVTAAAFCKNEFGAGSPEGSNGSGRSRRAQTEQRRRAGKGSTSWLSCWAEAS